MFRLKSLVMAPVLALCAAFVATALPRPALAQEIHYFRIGTGSISGVYFPVGGLIANIISNPPGSRACDEGGSCGVPGLIAVVQATHGSVANVRAIQSGMLESALAQSDIADFAYHGTGPFAGDKPFSHLRAIANLYPEAVHIVVRRDSPIKSVRDLVGRRVSLDLSGSGTRAVALMVLAGYGVSPDRLKQVNSQIGPAAERIHNGDIDAFFFVGGFPVAAISRLARETPIRLLPVDGKAAQKIRDHDRFLMATRIPKGTYHGVGTVDTVAVGAQWLVSSRVDAETVYGITRALWHPNTRRLLDNGVPAAREMRKENALKGIVIPLHPGAARYYRDQGMLRAPAETAPKSSPKAR